MPTLTLTAYVTTPDDLTMSRITDLAIHAVGGTEVLYATTRYDGQVSAWEVDGSSLTVRDADAHAGQPRAGAQPSLTFIGDRLLSGGGTQDRMVLRNLQADGAFGGEQTLTGTDFGGDLIQTVTLNLPDGRSTVYGGISGGAGIGQLVFSNTGLLQTTHIIFDTATAQARDITAMGTGQVGADAYVFTASTVENGVTAWRMGTDGGLTERGSLGAGEGGLWSDAPTALATAQVGGVTYLVMAAAGSSSLSVMAVDATGALTVTDHQIDTRDTRFAGVTALETVQHGGQTFVIAGGADDGISVLSLLPGGQLLHRTHLADTIAMSLANVSAITARADGTGLDLFVASATDPGLTRLRLETGTAGLTLTAAPSGSTLTGTSGFDLLTGGAGADQIVGNAGDDILIDGGGSDTLTGGSGADVFVMAADGDSDTITDFTLGSDRIDLGAWTGLRSVDQLFLTQISGGVQITYGDETVTVQSASGAPIAPDSLTDADLIGSSRLPETILPGLPGPITTPPALPDRPVITDPTPPPAPPQDGLTLIGTSAADTLRGAALDDLIWGQSEADTLFGAEGADMLDGGTGADTLYGGAGNDTLYGGGGRDTGWLAGSDTTSNADRLLGGAGDDLLNGQAGADWLNGQSGDDVLTGGGGRDTFVFTDGHDVITDFTPAVDRIVLDAALWTGTRTATQVLTDFARLDTDGVRLDFGSENVFFISDLDEATLLAGRIDFL